MQGILVVITKYTFLDKCVRLHCLIPPLISVAVTTECSIGEKAHCLPYRHYTLSIVIISLCLYSTLCLPPIFSFRQYLTANQSVHFLDVCCHSAQLKVSLTNSVQFDKWATFSYTI